MTEEEIIKNAIEAIKETQLGCDLTVKTLIGSIEDFPCGKIEFQILITRDKDEFMDKKNRL